MEISNDVKPDYIEKILDLIQLPNEVEVHVAWKARSPNVIPVGLQDT